MSQSAMVQSIIDRSIGIVTLQDPVYEEIEHDKSAISQAAIVTVIVGLAGGIGAIGDSGWGIIAGPIAGLIGWVVSAFFIYIVGTRVIPSTETEADLGQVLRLTGFAGVVGVANIVGFIPVVGVIVAIVAGIWGIVCLVKAVMHSLEMSIGRAIATAILAAIVAGICLAIVGAIFGVGLIGAS